MQVFDVLANLQLIPYLCFDRFMKLRLDRVLTDSFEAEGLEEALASNPTNLEFEKPEKWVAPYPKYEYGWWKPFLSPGQNEAKTYGIFIHYFAN